MASKTSREINRSAKYEVETTRVPGGPVVVVAECDTLAQARNVAAEYNHRRDLRYQDVVIRQDGIRVEFAGPAR